MEYISKIDGHITHTSQQIVENAKFNMLIIHGMAEHRHRYDAFMDMLNNHHINTYSIDLRGHGESPVDGHLGYFGAKDGYKRNVDDIDGIIQKIKMESDLPFILFGHSMGSLFARAYLKSYPNNIDAMILSGSPYLPTGFNALKQVLKIPAKISPTKPAKMIAKIMNDGFTKEIENHKTNVDWLSFDEDNINRYIHDPLCNFPFTYQGYVDLFALLDDVYNDAWPDVKSDLPVFFLVGKHDPVVDFKHDGFYKAINSLKQNGYRNIKSIVYDNSRHELLNDVEKEKVTEDIIQIINDLEL
ncbi:MAG TPA: alpha/beta fold hydrolase [Erysipelothrix sp.]|nr:alpha/beta fold hydrolase [Erysipelothrix sp.]